MSQFESAVTASVTPCDQLASRLIQTLGSQRLLEICSPALLFANAIKCNTFTPKYLQNLAMAPYTQTQPEIREIETFRLGPFTTPRLWTGLWQLSSNAWGSASVAKIQQGMSRHLQLGYTAFGKSPVLDRIEGY